MSASSIIHSHKDARILILSLRHLHFHVSRCWKYEFEDTICEFDTVDVIAPQLDPILFKSINKLAKHTADFNRIRYFLNPGFPKKNVLNNTYDLFFFVCQYPIDLIVLNSLKDWRQHCHYAVCLLDEIWGKDVDSWNGILKLLKDFDHVFLNLSSSVSLVGEIIQRPCEFLPYGADTVIFCPYPTQFHRSIDVYNIGRRSLITHEALLDLALQTSFFYVYDTIKNLSVSNYREHRSLYINFVKRSRYMIVNKAKFDLVQPTNPQEELSPRFFEGIAGGVVLLGTPPVCDAFTQNFDWQDAVISVPFDAPNISEIIADLNTQPQRLARIRQENVVNSLLRFDWVHHWEKILQSVGLCGTSEMHLRQVHLQHLAQMVNAQNPP